MLLGALFVFLLSRTLAHPVSLPPENPVPPASPVLNAFVAVSDCIRDPSKIRSTWELVWNCLGTVFVCTYVAIHPNLPDRDASQSRRTWQKVKTSLYALLAPEVVIMLAMRQRFVASRIARQHRGHGWTTVHGFFVQMGGFMCEVEKGYQVVTIGQHGEVHLGEGGPRSSKQDVMLPTVSEEEIQDKAKGDFLSKTVVVMQTSWFVLQCIARHAQSLVLTELELVTLAFATLNIITYFLWWSKPLNAGYPIYFKVNGTRTAGPLRISRGDAYIAECYAGVWMGWTGEEGLGIWEWAKRDIKGANPVVIIWKWLIQEPFKAVFTPLKDMIDNIEVHSPTYVGPYYSGGLSDAEGQSMMLLSSLIGVLFGVIHLFGWDFPFSTNAERILWRTSSAIVAIEPTLFVCAFVLSRVDDMQLRWVGAVIGRTLDGVGFIATMIGPVVYIFARIALLVQPLFALRDLPPTALQNVQWSDYIPHI
ncbi:hypothetical protein AX16_008432 [Volvariella volvacea WC 439]|nr:hypothetical protein AX16_008432 [Volvariella volvacea WC 439]